MLTLLLNAPQYATTKRKEAIRNLDTAYKGDVKTSARRSEPGPAPFLFRLSRIANGRKSAEIRTSTGVLALSFRPHFVENVHAREKTRRRYA